MNYRKKVEQFFNHTLDCLYPIRLGKNSLNTESFTNSKLQLIELLKQNIEEEKLNDVHIVESFFEQLPIIKLNLNKDVEAIYNGDPAAKSFSEIIITYPGFFAMAAYRMANFLLLLKVPLIPRIITEHAHSYTGIDIHPGARIGKGICIDHGTGVVVGETTVIGNNAKIYQGVTLGALSVNKKNIKGKRHPTIEDNVTIYAQATILGGQTTIGKNSVIGGNVWITKSVPQNSKVYYKANKYAVSENLKSTSKLKAI